MHNGTQKKDYKVVYTIVERARDKRKFWLRIGAAFTNRDGSLNVHLDAVPTNGTLHIREWRPFDEVRSGGARSSELDGYEEIEPARELAVG